MSFSHADLGLVSILSFLTPKHRSGFPGNSMSSASKGETPAFDGESFLKSSSVMGDLRTASMTSFCLGGHFGLAFLVEALLLVR